MGVSQLFHFRPFWRRGRRVADGSRHFVIGLDKNASNDGANTSGGVPAAGIYPKGRHFIVSYDQHDGVQLTSEELDICNNNSENAQQQTDYYLTPSASSHSSPSSPSSSSSTSVSELARVGGSVIFAMIPAENSYQAANSIAVVTTTELEEVQLFG